MDPAREPAAPDPGLEHLESLFETLAERVNGLLFEQAAEDHGTDVGAVAGSSAHAQENRAIHITRARLAAERARRSRERLPELLAQVRAGLQHIRQQEQRRAERSDPTGIARALGTAMSEVTGDGDPDTALHGVVRGAVSGIPGVDLAGISLRARRGELLREIGSHTVAEHLGSLQSATGEGPAADVGRSGSVVHVPDLAAHDVAWPAFAASAVASGIRSVIAFPLLSEFPTGSLSLWSRRPDVFGESTFVLGDLFVRHASLAIADAERCRNLLHAVDSRDLIGQAKGVLMVRRGIGSDEAFQLLLSSSQETNIKLVDVARWVVEHLVPSP